MLTISSSLRDKLHKNKKLIKTKANKNTQETI